MTRRRSAKAAPSKGGGDAAFAAKALPAKPKLDTADALRRRAKARIAVAGAAFFVALLIAGARLSDLAAGAPSVAEREALRLERAEERRERLRAQEAAAKPARRAMVDRNGVPLAGDAPVYDIYFDTDIVSTAAERAEIVEDLARIFPARSAAEYDRLLRGDGSPTIAAKAPPALAQQAFETGWPGFDIRPSWARQYHGGRLTAHVLGAVDADGIGVDGVEGPLDALLRASGPPVALSLDLRVQNAVREELAAALERYNSARGAATVLDPLTGEVLAMVSLPDFDPADRPSSAGARRAESPIFNHAAQALYELGSVMKAATWALALEHGLSDRFEVFTPRPFPAQGNAKPVEDYFETDQLSFDNGFARSSNIVAATLGLRAGAARQRAFYAALGFDAPTAVELQRARRADPGWADDRGERWSDSDTARASYGYAVSISPLHMAVAAARLINGGSPVEATLLKREGPGPVFSPRDAVVSPETSQSMRRLMRHGVAGRGPGWRATGWRAAVEGLDVGGKTGTAHHSVGGQYNERQVRASFVGAFPMTDPRAVVMVTLDHPTAIINGEPSHGGGATAAPTAGAIIARIAPFLGIAPEHEAPSDTAPAPAPLTGPEAWPVGSIPFDFTAPFTGSLRAPAETRREPSAG